MEIAQFAEVDESPIEEGSVVVVVVVVDRWR